MSGSNLMLWGAYVLFAGLAIYLNRHGGLFDFGGPLGTLKLIVWVAWLCFLAYSFYCSTRENLFRTVGVILKLHWGRQISADLYLGLFLGLIVIYLNEGLLTALLWLLPVLAFANLAVLLYFAVHFDSIAAKLLTL